VEHLLRATAQAEARHFWFRGFRAFVTPLVRSATRLHATARILDCGCGTGANLKLLGRFGCAYGFDLSAVGPRLARQSGVTRVVRANAVAAPFPDASFDLVTSFDVLYSLEDADERRAAAELFRLLAPGGRAIVNVAALNVLTGDHSVLSHERRRYTRASLRALLEGAGFTIVRITYTNATLFVPLALLRTFHRWRGLSTESGAAQEISVPPAPVNAVLGAALWLENIWLRWFNEPFGSSLLCMAEKPAGSATTSAAAGGPR
jgi:SAM-dependent methyltransferase